MLLIELALVLVNLMSTWRTWLASGTRAICVTTMPVDSADEEAVTAELEVHFTACIPSAEDISERLPITPVAESQLLKLVPESPTLICQPSYGDPGQK